MKIAYIVEPRKVIGGGVRAAINLAKAMAEYYGDDTAIFGTHKGGVKDDSVRFSEVTTLRPMGFAYWKALRRFLKGYDPDTVHCLGLYSALLLIVFRSLFRMRFKIVCTVHRVTMNMRFAPVMRFVIPYIAKRLDYATFLTGYQRNHYFNNVGFRPEKNAIIPNVIYAERYPEAEVEEKRKELLQKVEADCTTCYVGRIIPSKNIEDTIRLIGILNRRGLNVGAILVGGYSDPGYFDKLRRLIAEEGVEEKVHFEGYVNNPTLYISASTTTTTTTHGEALPNLMVESFALSKVVFSSDIPQMVDLIDDGKNGFTHSLQDLEGFADKMEAVYRNPELRKKIETEARKTYLDRYEPRLVAGKYRKVYETA